MWTWAPAAVSAVVLVVPVVGGAGSASAGDDVGRWRPELSLPPGVEVVGAASGAADLSYEVEVPDGSQAVPDDQMPEAAFFSGSATDTLADRQAGSRTCTYRTTSYANGGVGEGDDAYAVSDSEMGAHAGAHAHSGFPGTPTRKASSAYASVGWQGTYMSRRSHNVTFILPWNVLGEISTQQQGVPGASTTAIGEARVAVIVRDKTAGTLISSNEVRDWQQSGNSLQSYSSDGTIQGSLSMRPRHTYRAYVRMTTVAIAEGTNVNPGLQSDTTVDFLRHPRRAWLDYVKLRLDDPGVVWARC